VGHTTERVSVGTGGLEANGASRDPSISYDGRRVTFASDATNFFPGDTNGINDAFLRDRFFGTTVHVANPCTGYDTTFSSGARIAPDGNTVVYTQCLGGLETVWWRYDVASGTSTAEHVDSFRAGTSARGISLDGSAHAYTVYGGYPSDPNEVAIDLVPGGG